MRNQVEIKCLKLSFEDGCGQTGQQTRNDVKLQKKLTILKKITFLLKPDKLNSTVTSVSSVNDSVCMNLQT